MAQEQARYGWGSDLPEFCGTPARVIRGQLVQFVRDAAASQVRAWDDSIPPLQQEAREMMAADANATAYSAVLEYELPPALSRRRLGNRRGRESSRRSQRNRRR